MNKEINEIINNLEQTIGWCDRITTGNLPHKIGNLKQCLVSTIELLKVLNLGWHPASELPPLDGKKNSKPVIAICGIPDPLNCGRVLPKFSAVVGGVWIDKDVKLWCYPPKED